MVTFTPSEAQTLACKFLLANPRAALFMGLGLGKTAATLWALQYLLLNAMTKGALVVAPRRVCNLVWPAQVEEWEQFSWMRVANLRTAKGWKALERGSAHIYVINYESLPKLGRWMDGRDQVPFDVLVLDELTKCRNPKSTRIKPLRVHHERFPRRWGLTGTPNPKDLMDLFAQIRVLDDGKRLGPQFDAFQRRFFTPLDYNEYKWEPKSGSEEKIHALIADICLVLKSSDYSDVPDITTEDIEVELPDEAAKSYETLENDLIVWLKRHDSDEDAARAAIIADSAAVLVNKLLQVASGNVYDGDKVSHKVHDAKFKALKGLVQKLKEPVLVACNYIHEQECLKEMFGDACRLFRDHKGDRAQKELETAWNQGRIPVLGADPRSIGHGLNLQYGGRTVIWVSPTWDRELYDQMNGRVARKNQKLLPRCYRILCPDTMDDAVVETLKRRGNGQEALLNALKNYRRMVL